MARFDDDVFGENSFVGRDFDDSDRFSMRWSNRSGGHPNAAPRPESGRMGPSMTNNRDDNRFGGRGYGYGDPSRSRDAGRGWNERQPNSYGAGNANSNMNEGNYYAQGQSMSDDQFDRTYGSRLGQGMASGPVGTRTSPYGTYAGRYDGGNYGNSNDRSYGRNYGAGNYDATYASGYGQAGYGQYGHQSGYGQYHSGYDQNAHDDDGALTQIGHRIGSFVKNVFTGKKPFRGPKGYTRSDERIREDVSDALAHLGEPDPSDVEVLVSQGEVTLTGTVPYRRWKHIMEDAAESVSGVKDVINNIRVKAVDESRTMAAAMGEKNGDTTTKANTTVGTTSSRLSHS